MSASAALSLACSPACPAGWQPALPALSPVLSHPAPCLPFTFPHPLHPPCLPLQEALVKIAKKLKKNNVAVDIVSFGCEEENAEKLEAFHSAVASNDNSHLVTVPPGTILSDMLFGTPIFMEEGAGGGGGGDAEGGGGGSAPRSEDTLRSLSRWLVLYCCCCMHLHRPPALRCMHPCWLPALPPFSLP
jgi:hypothetical protein